MRPDSTHAQPLKLKRKSDPMRYRVDYCYNVDAESREEAARKAYDMMKRDIAAGRLACLAVYAQNASDAHAPPVVIEPGADHAPGDESLMWFE